MATSQFQRGGGVSGAASSSGGLDKVRAPYSFVPLSEHVFLPPWGEAASHDVPFEDGVCGTLDVEIEALSPLFIRGARDSKLFYETPDKTYAIPGTSIRGALRNVVEIASFSKLHRINDTRFAVRDLQNRTLYGDHMAEIQKGPDGKGIPVPLVNAGWLIPASQDEVDRGIGAWIVPCGFAKIHYKSVLEIARKKGVHGYQPGRRQQSPEKYRTWLGDLGPEKGQERLDKLAVEFLLKPERQKDVARGLISTYGKASLPTGAQNEQIRKGHLVFTGQPNNWDPERPPMKRAGAGNPKQHDFVFFGYLLEGEKQAMVLPVSVEQLADFESIHADGAQQGRTTLVPNVEWGYWSRYFDRARSAANDSVKDKDRGPEDANLSVRFRKTTGGAYAMSEADFLEHRRRAVPVFFLAQRKPLPVEIAKKRREYTVLKETFVRSFGLAMMFRLAYDHTVREGRSDEHKVQAPPEDTKPADIAPKLDFAETLFGHVPVDTFERNARGDRSLLKGRVSFETAHRVSGDADKKVGPVVLSAPKASFYPNYIEQRSGADPGAAPQGEWQTYQDEDFRLRGWKRYRPLDATVTPPRPKDGRGIEFDDTKMKKLGTEFTPVKRGARFKTRMHLHNVKLAELGALLWALDFGGLGTGDATDRPRHVMGLGRSIGYGQVQFRLKGGTLLTNKEAETPAPLDDLLTQARDAFVREMETFAAGTKGLGGWASSRQIYELIESGRPLAAADGRHMQIDHPGNGNEFVATKKSKKALAPAGTTTGWQRWKSEHPAPTIAAATRASGAAAPAPAGPAQSATPRVPGPVAAERKPWVKQAPGTKLRVRLVSITGSGNWKAELVEWQGVGTVYGKAPKGTYLNDVVEVVLTDGGNPKDMRLRWG